MSTDERQVAQGADTSAGDRLLTIAEVARRLAVSSRHVWRMISRRELPEPLKVGRSTRLCLSDVDGYVERLKLNRARAEGRAGA